MSRPLVFISVDGLAADQFQFILSRIAKHGLSLDGNFARIQSGPLASAQASWAELLTAAPWYENGCYNYAQPKGSLDRLQIISERLLHKPTRLLENYAESDTILYAVPLLESKSRFWFADGNFPTQQNVSANILKLVPDASQYTSKPYTSAANAMVDPQSCKRKAVELEIENLQLLKSLIRKKPSQILVARIRAFDQLAHLIGPHFLDKGLSIAADIDRLCAELSQLLQILISTIDNAHIFFASLFGHTKCLGRINLNKLLESENYNCQQQNMSVTPALQRSALSAIRGRTDDTADWFTSLNRTYIGMRAKAVSISNCVFLNDNRFDDGVEILDRAKMSTELQSLLLSRLQSLVPDTAIKVDQPPEQSPPAPTKAAMPDLIVQVPGYEFSNTTELIVDRENYPLTCHSSEGFLFAATDCRLPQLPLKPCQAHDILCAFVN